MLPELQTIVSVVDRRQTLPILSNILLDSSGSGFTLTATDMEVELVSACSESLGSNGQITIPARKLLDICRSLPEAASLEFDASKDRVQLRSGKSRFALVSQPAQEFPVTDIDSFPVSFSIDAAVFKSLLEDTLFAMAQQDVRYYLNGLLLEIDTRSLRAVATDGHRLAMKEEPVSSNVKDMQQIIVPRKGVMELVRLIDDNNETLEVNVSSNHIRFQIGHIRFTSKLIDGKFPDYQRVIPREDGSVMLAKREVLKQSLTRASILSNEKYRGVRIEVSKDSLKAQAQNPEQEEAEEEIAVTYAGDSLEIGFNVTYLLDAIAAIKTDKIKIVLTDANSSCLILPDDDSQCRYVVMPMRL
ncbi:MAG: DNA polymerase III subunit beta [Thiotrichales bacterium]|nr:DNA polymerase III subunit beta [Thiotrichales bacterium]